MFRAYSQTSPRVLDRHIPPVRGQNRRRVSEQAPRVATLFVYILIFSGARRRKYMSRPASLIDKIAPAAGRSRLPRVFGAPSVSAWAGALVEFWLSIYSPAARFLSRRPFLTTAHLRARASTYQSMKVALSARLRTSIQRTSRPPSCRREVQVGAHHHQYKQEHQRWRKDRLRQQKIIGGPGGSDPFLPQTK